MTVSATIVVDFRGAAEADVSASLQAEIDDRPNGYNGGRTAFYVGDRPVYLTFVHRARILRQALTYPGSVAYVGAGLMDVTDNRVEFFGTQEGSLAYPFHSWIPSDDAADRVVWEGNQGGALSIEGRSVVHGNASIEAAILKIRYRAEFQAWRFEGVPESLSRVGAYIVGEALL